MTYWTGGICVSFKKNHLPKDSGSIFNGIQLSDAAFAEQRQSSRRRDIDQRLLT